jgi:hypothetical protein
MPQPSSAMCLTPTEPSRTSKAAVETEAYSVLCCVTCRRIALVNWRAAKEAAKAAFRAQAVALGEAGCSAALGASLVSDVLCAREGREARTTSSR